MGLWVELGFTVEWGCRGEAREPCHYQRTMSRWPTASWKGCVCNVFWVELSPSGFIHEAQARCSDEWSRDSISVLGALFLVRSMLCLWLLPTLISCYSVTNSGVFHTTLCVSILYLFNRKHKGHETERRPEQESSNTTSRNTKTETLIYIHSISNKYMPSLCLWPTR